MTKKRLLHCLVIYTLTIPVLYYAGSTSSWLYWVLSIIPVLAIILLKFDSNFSQKKFTVAGCSFVSMGAIYISLGGVYNIGWLIILAGIAICALRDFLLYRWSRQDTF